MKTFPCGRPRREGEGDGYEAVAHRREALVDGIDDARRRRGRE
jgi:hypothetical protein